MIESTYPFAFISFQHQDYTIQITGPDAGVVSKLSGLNITIPEPYGTDPSTTSSGSNVGAIAGGIAGVVVVLAALFLIVRQRKKKNLLEPPQQQQDLHKSQIEQPHYQQSAQSHQLTSHKEETYPAQAVPLLPASESQYPVLILHQEKQYAAPVHQFPVSQYSVSGSQDPVNLTSHPRPNVVLTMGSDPKGGLPHALLDHSPKVPQEPWEPRPFAPLVAKDSAK